MLGVVACPGKFGFVINNICCESSGRQECLQRHGSLLEVYSVCVIAVACHWGCLVSPVKKIVVSFSFLPPPRNVNGIHLASP